MRAREIERESEREQERARESQRESQRESERHLRLKLCKNLGIEHFFTELQGLIRLVIWIKEITTIIL